MKFQEGEVSYLWWRIGDRRRSWVMEARHTNIFSTPQLIQKWRQWLQYLPSPTKCIFDGNIIKRWRSKRRWHGSAYEILQATILVKPLLLVKGEWVLWVKPRANDNIWMSKELMELLKYVTYIKDGKIKVSFFLSGQHPSYASQIHITKPRALAKAIWKVWYCEDQYQH